MTQQCIETSCLKICTKLVRSWRVERVWPPVRLEDGGGDIIYVFIYLLLVLLLMYIALRYYIIGNWLKSLGPWYTLNSCIVSSVRLSILNKTMSYSKKLNVFYVFLRCGLPHVHYQRHLVYLFHFLLLQKAACTTTRNPGSDTVVSSPCQDRRTPLVELNRNLAFWLCLWKIHLLMPMEIK